MGGPGQHPEESLSLDRSTGRSRDYRNEEQLNMADKRLSSVQLPLLLLQANKQRWFLILAIKGRGELGKRIWFVLINAVRR